MYRIIVPTLFVILLILISLTNQANAQNKKESSPDLKKAIIDFSNKQKLYLFSSIFDTIEHKVKRCKIVDWSGICLIDGKPIFGTDWDLPISQLDSAYIDNNGIKIKLDVSCMFNPWFGEKPEKNNFTIEDCEAGFFLNGYFSGSAGSYVAQWKIIDNVSIRTIIASDEELINKFINDN